MRDYSNDKQVADGYVSSRVYYYLLDFKDEDGKRVYYTKYGVSRVSELTIEQCKDLLELACDFDLSNSFWQK